MTSNPLVVGYHQLFFTKETNLDRSAEQARFSSSQPTTHGNTVMPSELQFNVQELLYLEKKLRKLLRQSSDFV